VNCGEITRLAPLYITGELDGKRAAEFDKHLRSCSACIEEVERLARLDARLREVILAQETDVAEVNRRVRDLIAAESRGHRLPRFRPGWRRWAAVAAAACLVAALVALAGSFAKRVPRVYLDAATDHRLEVIEHQPRPWSDRPQQIVSLAEQQGIAPAAVAALASGPYRLVRGKLCYLDHRLFLHLVLSSGAREISVYLGQRYAQALSGPMREIANGKPLCTSDLYPNHVASVETPDLVVLVVTEESPASALTFARFAAAVL
jgi:anti-sigma factor RsiW